jgi:hypothetical protein
MYSTFLVLPILLYIIVVVLLVIWIFSWKIYAVWLAVKNNQKKWFITLLLLNTLSLLEMYYVFKVLKKSKGEVKEDFKEAWNVIRKNK